jgi:hypothetical protein
MKTRVDYRFLKIERTGLRVDGKLYWHPGLAGRNHRVLVKKTDAGSLEVFDWRTQARICEAHEVKDMARYGAK